MGIGCLDFVLLPNIHFQGSLFYFLIVVISLCLGCSKPPPFVANQIEHGLLFSAEGVWILKLEGSPAERGEAAGRLIREQIRWLVPRYLRKVFGSSNVPEAFQGRLHTLGAQVPETQQEELRSMAKAAGVEPSILLAANLSPELFSSQMCSCLGVRSEKSQNGKVLLARNLDWLGGEDLTRLRLVVIEKGPRHAFASVSFPGLVGAVTGMNDRGLALANLVVLGEKRQTAPGVPVLFLVRQMLEECGSVEEAISWLRKTKRTIPQNYALADHNTLAAVETDTSQVKERMFQGPLMAITNYFGEDHIFRKDNRYRLLMELASFGRLTKEDLKSALSKTAIKGMNVQAAVLEPSTLFFEISVGDIPAADGPWVRLELKPLLGDRLQDLGQIKFCKEVESPLQ